MERYNNYSLDELEAELYIFSICVRDTKDPDVNKTRLYLINLIEEKVKDKYKTDKELEKV